MSNKPKKTAPLERPSGTFEEAFRDGVGGCAMDCYCGRLCFDGVNSYDWELDELEGYREEAAKHPDKYAELPYSVDALTVDGKTFVMGCPCNGARRYEDWIRNHAEKLARFLVGIRQERLDRAEALAVADKLAHFPPDPDVGAIL